MTTAHDAQSQRLRQLHKQRAAASRAHRKAARAAREYARLLVDERGWNVYDVVEVTGQFQSAVSRDVALARKAREDAR